MIFFFIKAIYPILDETADFMAELLSWNNETKQTYMKEFQEDLKLATVFE